MLIKESDRVSQILVATINNTVSPQTSAITSGTSECSEDGMVKSNYKVDVFANVNFENLKQDMAQGDGEYLASLASLMEIEVGQQEDFFNLTQEKFSTLVPSESTTSNDLVASLNRELSSHPTLSVVVQ